VLIVATYNILIYFGGVFGLDFELIGVSAIISNAIKYWWVFLIFWPVVILKIPFSFFGRKGEGGGNALVSFLFAPIYEELAFRYFAINTIFLLTGSIEMAVFFQAIGFSLIHLPNKDKNGWAGPVSLNFTLVGGLITGIIAVQAGLLIAILSHMIINIINRFVGDFL
jgi:hypothetical protein